MIILLMLIIFFALMLFGVPIAFSLGASALSAVLLLGYDPVVFVHKMANSLSSFSLIAVPLYVLAGNLCSETGITKRLVRMCDSLVGHIPGGTGLVNVLASLFFGGISGSAVADTSAIGGMLIPIMKEEGYDSEFSCGITMASSTIGILIPPSIPLCLYGICTETSIGAMFMAGFLPGIFVGFLQMIICYFISKKRSYHCKKKATTKEIIFAIKDALWALGMPLIIFIGCGTGIVTATEAGVIAVVYSLLIGFFVYHELDVRRLPKVLLDSIITSSVALFIVGVASVISWIINIENIPAVLVDFLSTKVASPFLIMLIINVILFICGCFMDLVPIMLLFAPIFLPIAEQCGINAITFGIIMTVNLGIGLVTPPVGNCLFIASEISKTPAIKLFKASLPFVMCNVLCFVLIHLIPGITLWLPHLFKY